MTERTITPEHMLAYLEPRVRNFRERGLSFGEVRFTCPEEGTDKAQVAFALFLTVLEQLGCLPCSIITEPAPAAKRAIVLGTGEPVEEAMTRYKVIFKICGDPADAQASRSLQ